MLPKQRRAYVCLVLALAVVLLALAACAEADIGDPHCEDAGEL